MTTNKIYYKSEGILVKGDKVSKHFACQEDKTSGWMITHIESETLLTNAGFDSLDTCKDFIRLLEMINGMALDEITKDSNPLMRPENEAQRKIAFFIFKSSDLPIITNKMVAFLTHLIYALPDFKTRLKSYG